MTPRKGLKVTDAERKTRVGIAVGTLADLRTKTAEKFKLSSEEQIVFQTRDGVPLQTEPEFAELEPQTLLIWTRKGERAETDAEILYRTIREVNIDFLKTGEMVQEFFTEQMKNKVYKLAEVLKSIEDEDRAHLSFKKEDPQWFEGVDSRSKTKEEYMFRRAQDRIRTYYYKSKDELLRSEPSEGGMSRDTLLRLLGHLQRSLKEVDFFGCYFDRRKAAAGDVVVVGGGGGGGGAICDRGGTFECQGRWDKEACLYRDHRINPYRSREDRIVFQTWNLDHGVERSRSVIPAIREAVRVDPTVASLHLDRIFDDLFTLKNLKLVHVVCHDKGVHGPVDSDRYTGKTKTKKNRESKNCISET